MKRLLWLGIGLAVGGLVVRAASRKARAYRPSSLAGAARDSVGGLAGSVRSFVDDVRDGMAERERQIHQALAEARHPGADHADQEDPHGREDQEGIR